MQLNLAAIGFDAPGGPTLRDLLRTDNPDIERTTAPDGSEVWRLCDPSGGRLAGGSLAAGGFCFKPAFRPAVPSTVEATVLGVLPQDCRNCDVVALELASGARCAVELDAIAEVRDRLVPGAQLTFELAAFASDWQIHPDAESYQVDHGDGPAQPLAPDPAWASTAEPRKGRFGRRSVEAPAEWTAARGLLTGTIESARRLRSALGGGEFLHLVVDNPWLTVDVVGHESVLRGPDHFRIVTGPGDAEAFRTHDDDGVPRLGTVLNATVWLVGRLAEGGKDDDAVSPAPAAQGSPAAAPVPPATAPPGGVSPTPPWLDRVDVATWPTRVHRLDRVRCEVPLREGWAFTGEEEAGAGLAVSFRGHDCAELFVAETHEDAVPGHDMRSWVDAPLTLTGFPVLELMEYQPQLIEFDYWGAIPGFAASLGADEAHQFLGMAALSPPGARRSLAQLYIVLVRRDRFAWKFVLSFLTACPPGTPWEMKVPNDHLRAGATFGRLRLW